MAALPSVLGLCGSLYDVRIVTLMWVGGLLQYVVKYLSSGQCGKLADYLQGQFSIGFSLEYGIGVARRI